MELQEHFLNKTHLEPKMASAAQVAPYMPSGFVQPMDYVERRAFAERAGLELGSVQKMYSIY